MNAYQAGLAKFEGLDTQVLAVSTDNLPTLSHWVNDHLKSGFPLMSDFMRTISADYGVLNKEKGYANRTTFVIDIDGKIQHIEQGKEALSADGAATACSRTKHKASE